MKSTNVLRIEVSAKVSGKIVNSHKIYVLKKKRYTVEDISLDGDAPKQFIRVYEKNDVSVKRSLRSNRKVWISYIAKTAEKWYPHESIIEYAINRIGQVLNLKMNEVKLVVANKQIRFLSKFFLNRGKEVLVHGADICAEHFGNLEEAIDIANNRSLARKHFTFEFVKDAIRLVFPNEFQDLMSDFVRMLVFDAIVGNNDRHFYNWGVIRSINNRDKSVTFAPLYDSARGLMWNESDQRIKEHLERYDQGNVAKIVKYLKKSCPRISINDNKEVNHFELVDFLKGDSLAYREIIEEMLSSDNENKIFGMLEKEIFVYFDNERKRIITLVLKKRLEELRSI